MQRIGLFCVQRVVKTITHLKIYKHNQILVIFFILILLARNFLLT